ncbi:LysR family transcriptional regulator [uncultured Roseobacter sp.]|uniref:LysR family transcriptional regulator n=1 Tax=uncultured Roseobacter sp. TaxID=114847 RepID=UPI002609BF6F|nr:LysR family transcriptional regulator [uncultured Roseobacter sp.]
MNGLPPLSSITAFVQVALHGAFNEAARSLDLSPSATSKAVTRLEDHLGVKLLHRTTRSVSLTPEGERYLEGARRLLDEFRGLDEEISSNTSAPRGRLTVNAPAALARIWLSRILPIFHAKFPQVQVELVLDDKTVDLAAEAVDVVIRSGSLADSVNLVAKKLYEGRLYVCATPEYWGANGRPDHPEQLASHKCLNFRAAQTGRLFPWVFSVEGEARSMTFEGPLTTNDGETVARAAQAGLGVAQLPGYMAAAALRQGHLEKVLEEFAPPPTPMTALYLDRRLVSPKIRAFVDFLVDSVRDERNERMLG